MDSLQEMFYGKPKTEESEEKKNGEETVDFKLTLIIQQSFENHSQNIPPPTQKFSMALHSSHPYIK